MPRWLGETWPQSYKGLQIGRRTFVIQVCKVRFVKIASYNASDFTKVRFVITSKFYQGPTKIIHYGVQFRDFFIKTNLPKVNQFF